MTEFEDIPETALRWHQAGQGAALATVTQTWGSAPRRVGAQLAIRADGTMAGSVSGGCVENDVALHAQDVLDSGLPKLVTYGIADEEAFEVGLTCGGTIDVFIEAL